MFVYIIVKDNMVHRPYYIILLIYYSHIEIIDLKTSF